MRELFVICNFIFLPYFIVYGDSFSTVVPINIELNSTIKSGLRYGFQKTSDCLNFEKSFLCVQKCLDLNFDVAHADKNCMCTCHIKKEKAKYTLKYNSTRTKWKLGAPTTSIPPWAQHKKITEQTESDNIIELHGSDPEHASANQASNPTATTAKNITASSDDAKGAPGGFIETGPSAGSLATDIETGNATTAETGTVSGGATETVANAATGAAIGTLNGTVGDIATIARHDGTNAPATEGSVTTHAAS